MSTHEGLAGYMPEDQRSVKVKLQDDLASVVCRIGQYLPQQIVWELFHSSPGETEGVITFPYCRVDMEIAESRFPLSRAKRSTNPEQISELYQSASLSAFKALVWVEVGFKGLQNLAASPASMNWTSGVGHFVDATQRAEGIMTGGKEFYEQGLKEFVQFRTERGITADYFTQYGLEHLLNPFRV